MHTETPKPSRGAKPRPAAKTTRRASARTAGSGAGKRPARSAPAAAEAGSADIRDSPFAESMRTEADADLRHRLISEAAYALFTQRGYRDGFDVDDWLEAEARIDGALRAGLPLQEAPEET